MPILRRLTGQAARRSHALSEPGTPVPIPLKERQEGQTIFEVQRDGTLVGFDYPPGDDVLMTSASVDFDDPSFVHIAGVPLIRTTRRQSR